ncbi:MAG: hypothetical protein GWN14_06910 [candidate division Zixibacteria bacterium]|nr:hypothetical protein [candidate division Zixibacteria bacterium]NIW44529.1 hypothetical protein [Gammaproteobacteria bacterium]NIX55654.1 hypothetical protein [candidate division Zixibacteria bacterium]
MKHLQLILMLGILLLSGNFLAQNTAIAASCCNVPGDANDDGGANVSDAVYIINYVFVGGAAPSCFEKGDANCDALVNVSDAVYIINFVFVGGAAPCCMDVVFNDEYGSRVTYQAFAGSFLEAVQVTTDPVYEGTQGLEITIPGTDPWWSGGAFVDTGGLGRAGRDLSAYNALTFWARASIPATLDVAGIANDNTGTSEYIAEVTALALTTSWQQYVIPIPLAEKLDSENGLFYFAEGEGVEYQIWVDEIVFDSLTTITNPRPVIPTTTLEVSLGEEVTFDGCYVTFDVDGSDIVVSAMMGYFNFASSDEGVVSVGTDGVITAVGPGTAELTAVLGTSKSVPADGVVTVNVSGFVPTESAPTPSQDQADVFSIFSDTYISTDFDTWSSQFDNADVSDFTIGSDNLKKYTNLVFSIAEYEVGNTGPQDLTGMTHFHMDVWTPDPTDGSSQFNIKLVDFGANGEYGGGDDVEDELAFGQATMSTGSWVSFDIPLASFTGLTTQAHFAQLILSGTYSTVYVDNVYFYDAGIPTDPEVPAPTPTVPSENVVALWSDVYTNNPIDTWSAVWDQADVADFLIGSDSTKKYTNLNFAGIEFTTTTLDASTMTHFHMDVWTPDPTNAPNVFKVKLVDAGADGVIGTGDDDVEDELIFDENTMNTAEWVSIDVPLADFTGLTTTAHLAQMIISGDPNTVFIDNIYFYVPAAAEPTSSAPTPSQDPGDVFSVFSDTYTSTDFDTWSSIYDNADVSDFTIGSDNLKKYTNLVFSIAEYEVGNTGPQDLTGMTHFHMDVWTPDPTTASDTFKIKLVDFGANGEYGGGDDVEGELVFDQATMSTGSWVSFDIPLANFTGLTTQAHFAQLILSGTYGTVFVDNVYFYIGSEPTEPTSSAPTPTDAPADVFSVFSDTYTSTDFDTWSSIYDNVDVSDFTIGSDNLKRYTNLIFSIAEYEVGNTGPQDLTGMTHFHMDVWTPVATDGSSEFKIKLVDFGANGEYGGGDDVEDELTFDQGTMSTGSWVSFDIPLANFTGLTTQAHFAQMILSGTYGTVFVDNVYFHK